jgi:KEOPS complex subunit Pcc1
VHTAEFVFRYASPRAAALVAAAIDQEAGEIDGGRSSATVRREGEAVYVDVDADDLVALRAGMNTWSTLVEVAERSASAGGVAARER